jgi:hypothetical protein
LRAHPKVSSAARGDFDGVDTELGYLAVVTIRLLTGG